MTIQNFYATLRGKCLVEPGSTVIVACSGGADSIALLQCFYEIEPTYPLDIICVHVEHGIRGEESLRDAAFVRSFCEERQIAFRLCSVNVPKTAEENGQGIEAAAREMRYRALEAVQAEVQAAVIAVAHHRRDQAETILMHILRGCDPDALSGMQWRDNDIIRPFLAADPEELKTFLRDKGITWREDSTNTDTAYTRNRIRHCVLPELEKAYAGAETAICRLGDAAGRDRAFFREQIEALNLPGFTYRFPGGLAVPADRLSGLHPAVGTRAIVSLIRSAGLPAQNRDIIEAVFHLAVNKTDSAENLTGNGRARMWRGLLILATPFEAADADVPQDAGEVVTGFGTFTVRPAKSGETGDGRHSQAVPSELLRGARIGLAADEPLLPFLPFGRRETAGTVMSFLTKVPLPAEIRSRIPVIYGRNGAVWIPGVRPAEMVRYGDGPRTLLTWKESQGIEKIVEFARHRQ